MRKYKKMTDANSLAKYIHRRLAKSTAWPDWDTAPDVVRQVWIDEAKIVLQLVKQRRI